MTKRILVVGAAKRGKDAVSGIMESLVAYAPESTGIYFFSFRKEEEKVPDSFDWSVADLHTLLSPITWWFQGKKRLFRVFKWDDCLWASSYAYYKLNRLAKNIRFDAVIGVAGLFYYTQAAYLFACKHNLPLKLVYFDPFTNNITTRNLARRLAIEKQWLGYAKQVYYNAENILPEEGILKKKAIPFYIPISLKSLQNWCRNNSLVYGGNFYPQIRQPNGLYELAQSLQDTDWKIECYSNLRNHPVMNNVKFAPLLQRSAFEQRCNQAGALIYIGNCGGNCRSSKYLECMGYRKPIVGINVSKDDEVRKYKYYWDATDSEWIERISDIPDEELRSHNPFVDFPQRDPKKLARVLFS